MKKIVVGIITVLGLTLIQSPAHADVCSNGTISVAGINTFGQLPCSDPGTEINVTVRGLHDYGVSGGPTAYCSFNYVRRNIGTTLIPNWSVSTDTVCDPRPIQNTAPVPLIIEPVVVQSTPTQTTLNESKECSASNPCMNYAVVDNSNSVTNVIVCQPSFCSGMIDSNGNRYVPQEAANPVTHDYHGTNARISRPEENKIVTFSSDGIFTVTQNGQIVEKFIAPEIVIEKTNTSTIVTTTSIEANFGDTNSVKINATQSINSSTVSPDSVINNINNVKETIVFEERKTEEEAFMVIRENNNLVLIKSKLSMLTRLLPGWFL